MMTSTRKLSASLVMLGACAVGQLSATVGPSPAPLGGVIVITVANDTAFTQVLATQCPYQVRDSNGAVIFVPLCSGFPVLVSPFSLYTLSLPSALAGNYLVDVFLPGIRLGRAGSHR